MGGYPGTGGNKIGWLADTDAASETGQAAVTDIQFELKGRALPKDHGYELFLELARLLPWIASMRAVDGRAAAYVCRGFTCQSPTSSAEELTAQLST